MDMTWKAVRNAIDREALLKRMGLEERTPAGDFFTGLGLFAVGVLVGAGLGLMFAPKRGEEMRATLNEAWRNRGRGEPDYQRDLAAETSVAPSGH
jgi:gas vesicle protein